VPEPTNYAILESCLHLPSVLALWNGRPANAPQAAGGDRHASWGCLVELLFTGSSHRTSVNTAHDAQDGASVGRVCDVQ
jgi:hypothetical protein